MTDPGRVQRYVSVVPRMRSNLVERLPAELPDGWSMTVLALAGRDDLDTAVTPPTAVQVEFTSLRAALVELFRRPPDVLEVPEPLWFRFVPVLWLVVLTARLSARAHGRPRPLVGSFVMENLSPDTTLRSKRLGLPGPLHRPGDALLRALAQRTVGLVDAVFWCSAGARANYLDSFSRASSWQTTGGQELMPPCACLGSQPKTRRVLFCAELSTRKGVPDLMSAWEAAAQPGWRLDLLGFGAMEAEVRAWVEARDDATLTVRPERERIHAAFAAASVLVLPSVREPFWREQVGYPVLEGLAHRCRVVTTSESGAAEWLTENGHQVVPPHAPDELAAAIRTAMLLGADDSPLPARDSRQEFERWLISLRGGR